MNITQHTLARPMIVRRGPSGLLYLRGVSPGAVSPHGLPFVVRWLFLLFIFLIGFEVSSWTARTGFLLSVIYFGYHNPFFGKRSFPAIPRVMMWFVIYVAIYALYGLFIPAERSGEFFISLFTLIQVTIFLWFASDILKDEKMFKKAVLVFSVGAGILACGLVLSLPGFGVTAELGEERASVMGQNANALAYIMALGVVALLGLWLNLSRKRLVESVWMLGLILVLCLATVYTGSRGGVLMLMIGLSVYTFPYWKNRWRLSTGIVALIGMAGLAYIAAMTPAFSERWRDYVEGSDTSGRDIIVNQSFEMLSERPLLGWQPVEFAYELGRRTYARAARDTHNTFLYVLLQVGIVGALPFVFGLWLCGKGAWQARNRSMGLLPIALLVASLAGGMTSTTIHLKPQWFVFAIAVAAGAQRKRQDKILVVRPVENGIQAAVRR